MGLYAVYTLDMDFLGYLYASNPRHAREQAKRKYDLVGEATVFLCTHDAPREWETGTG